MEDFVKSIHSLQWADFNKKTIVYDVCENLKNEFIPSTISSALEDLFFEGLKIPIQYALFYNKHLHVTDVERRVCESYGIFLFVLSKDMTKLKIHKPTRVLSTKVNIVQCDGNTYKSMVANDNHGCQSYIIKAIMMYLYATMAVNDFHIQNVWSKIRDNYITSENSQNFSHQLQCLLNEENDDDLELYLNYVHTSTQRLCFEKCYEREINESILLSRIMNLEFSQSIMVCKYKKNESTINNILDLVQKLVTDVNSLPNITDCDNKTADEFLTNIKRSVKQLCDNLETDIKNKTGVVCQIRDDVFTPIQSLHYLISNLENVQGLARKKFHVFIETVKKVKFEKSLLDGQIIKLTDLLNNIRNGKFLLLNMTVVITEVLSVEELKNTFAKTKRESYGKIICEKRENIISLYREIEQESQLKLINNLLWLAKNVFSERELPTILNNCDTNAFICTLLETVNAYTPWGVIDLIYDKINFTIKNVETFNSLISGLNLLVNEHPNFCTFTVPKAFGVNKRYNAKSADINSLKSDVANNKFFTGKFLKIIPTDEMWDNYTIEVQKPFPLEFECDTIFGHAHHVTHHWEEQALSRKVSYDIHHTAKCLKDILGKNTKYIMVEYSYLQLKNTVDELNLWITRNMTLPNTCVNVLSKLNDLKEHVEEVASCKLQEFISSCLCKDINLSGDYSFPDFLDNRVNSGFKVNMELLYEKNVSIEKLIQTGNKMKTFLLEMRSGISGFSQVEYDILYRIAVDVLTDDPFMLGHLSPLNTESNFLVFLYIMYKVIDKNPYLESRNLVIECLSRYKNAFISDNYQNIVIVQNSLIKGDTLLWDHFYDKNDIRKILRNYLLNLDNNVFISKIRNNKIIEFTQAELQIAFDLSGQEKVNIYAYILESHDKAVLHKCAKAKQVPFSLYNIQKNIKYLIKSHSDTIHISILKEYFQFINDEKYISELLGIRQENGGHNKHLIFLEKKTVCVLTTPEPLSYGRTSIPQLHETSKTLLPINRDILLGANHIVGHEKDKIIFSHDNVLPLDSYVDNSGINASINIRLPLQKDSPVVYSNVPSIDTGDNEVTYNTRDTIFVDDICSNMRNLSLGNTCDSIYTENTRIYIKHQSTQTEFTSTESLTNNSTSDITRETVNENPNYNYETIDKQLSVSILPLKCKSNPVVDARGSVSKSEISLFKNKKIIMNGTFSPALHWRNEKIITRKKIIKNKILNKDNISE
jgi:hypothetical protein